MTNTVMGLFDDTSTAEKVRDELTSSGFNRSNVSIDKEDSSGGLRDDLVKRGVAQEDAEYYVKGISQGGALVTVQADETRTDEAVAIMDRYADDAQGQDMRAEPVDSARTERTVAGEDQVTLETAEEEIKVGKRAVAQGGKRIRTYVSETPVEEQVTLRDEEIHVERKKVDRPVSEVDGDPFQERTVEMTETDEEAVVSKEARVTGEVVVEKDVTEHTETVKDTVRRTEVEVEETDVKERRDS